MAYEIHLCTYLNPNISFFTRFLASTTVSLRVYKQIRAIDSDKHVVYSTTSIVSFGYLHIANQSIIRIIKTQKIYMMQRQFNLAVIVTCKQTCQRQLAKMGYIYTQKSGQME